jgi:hypothetical protein
MASARVALRRGDLGWAQDCWRQVTTQAPHSPEAIQADDGLRHAARLNALAGVGDGR